MSQTTYEQALEEASRLSVEDQLRLIGNLAERLRSTCAAPETRRPISDFFGVAPNSDRVEDAQAWVSRMRNESDQRLEKR
jgi:hypothetical protein